MAKKMACVFVLLAAAQVSQSAFVSYVPVLQKARTCYVLSSGVGGRRGLGAAQQRMQLDRIESKAIEKFTTQYEKLCKTCPTRLQPRVDTLVGMISGLPANEKAELFSRLGLVFDVKAAEDITGVDDFGTITVPIMQDMTKAISDLSSGTMKPGKETMDGELEEKQNKLAKNARKLSMVKSLLAYFEVPTGHRFDVDAAKLALAEQVGAEHSMEMVEEFVMELRELEQMPPEKREKRRLKLVEKRAKYERKAIEYQEKLDMMAKKPEPALCSM